MAEKYISDEKAIKDILDIGQRMYYAGFAAANDGNISVRTGKNEVWTTPSGVSKGFMIEEMLIKTDLDGNVIAGSMKPSSELKMHLEIYKELSDAGAVVHAHPPVATSFAVAGIPLDKAYLQESVVRLGVIPVVPYELPGTEALAESVGRYCRDYNGLLLEHHGAVTWAFDAVQAFYLLESIEYDAKVTMNLRLMGIERLMTEEQTDELIALRADWGVIKGGRPKSR